MEKILIIGGTGFIGSELIKQLSKSYEIIVSSLGDLPENLRKDNIKFIRADALDPVSLEKCFQEHPAIVIDLLGQIVPDRELLKKINLEGNKNIISLIKKYNVKKTIFTSSSMVYGESPARPSIETDPKVPVTFYADLKSQVEELFIKSNLDVIILRLGNVYGIGQQNGLIPNLLKAFKTDSPINVANHEKLRTFINIHDVARAVELALRAKFHKVKIYNLGKDKLSIQEVIKIIEDKLNYRFKKNSIEANDENTIIIDSSLAKKELGFEPRVNFIKGIEEIIKNGKQ